MSPQKTFSIFQIFKKCFLKRHFLNNLVDGKKNYIIFKIIFQITFFKDFLKKFFYYFSESSDETQRSDNTLVNEEK